MDAAARLHFNLEVFAASAAGGVLRTAAKHIPAKTVR